MLDHTEKLLLHKDQLGVPISYGPEAVLPIAPEGSAGTAGAELLLGWAVLLLDKVSSQGTGRVTSLCPFAVGGSGQGCSGCPGNTAL